MDGIGRLGSGGRAGRLRAGKVTERSMVGKLGMGIVGSERLGRGGRTGSLGIGKLGRVS